MYDKNMATRFFFEIKRTNRGFIGLVRGKHNVRGLPLTVLHRRIPPRKNRAAAEQACVHTIAALEAVERMPRDETGRVITGGTR